MLLPSVFGENLFENFIEGFAFPDVEKALYGKHGKNLMKTDVKETETGYVVDIDLAGFQKDEIKMQLDHGYLTVSASKGLEKEEKDQKGNYVRRERYGGSMSRRFYVGEHVTEADIHPKYENGILTFGLPKEEKKAVEEKRRYIAIEG
ncbi:MAG: Hsp20/alpha crystallin family protein [Lachnospiraceae bacterium]|nr:Hsp20/alpha crystallin family protein [Lachnospiraceae bacterium]